MSKLFSYTIGVIVLGAPNKEQRSTIISVQSDLPLNPKFENNLSFIFRDKPGKWSEMEQFMIADLKKRSHSEINVDANFVCCPHNLCSASSHFDEIVETLVCDFESIVNSMEEVTVNISN